MSRLSEQAARLDVDSYPVRFAYRTLFSDMDTNRHLNNGAFSRMLADCVTVKATAGRPAPLSEGERERLAGMTFAGAEIGGRQW